MDYLKQLNTLDLSKLHFYSYGYVVEENKGNKVAKVYPYEKLYSIGGIDDLSKPIDNEITWKNNKIKSIKNNTGDVFEEWGETNSEQKVKVRKSYYILAKWAHMFQSNRTTPPYLGIGEKVIIFRYSNNDEYYWDTIATDLDLRRNETVNWFFRGNKSGYSLTFSPEHKYIELKTNKEDDQTEFTFKINGDNHKAYLQWGSDNKNDFFILDYKNKVSGIKFGKNMVFKTGDNMVIQAKKLHFEGNGDELIKWLTDLLKAILQETHIGNLGAETPLTSKSIQNYQKLLQRLEKAFLLREVPGSIKNLSTS